MASIKIMDPVLACQIAAGEVVERPASVVKELVENAIDAEASRIQVEIIEAGVQSIKVIDNGKGMDEEDLALAVQAHATSKVYRLEDLFQIRSLGFRGEALASIASVSKLRIESSPRDSQAAHGHFIELEAGRVIEQGVCPYRAGTQIEVKSLFYNTPARLKHLAQMRTEMGHIQRVIQDLSMAHPEIEFVLLADGQKVLQTHGRELRQALANIYNPTIARQLLQIEAENLDFHIQGFVSPPQITRKSRTYIHWMINGRNVQSLFLTNVLLRAYGKRLMIGRYPLAAINIIMDPRLVDVNVHPSKQTVRLSKEEELAKVLGQAVQTALQAVNPIPNLDINLFNPTRTSKSVQESVPFEFTYNKTQPEKEVTQISKIQPENLTKVPKIDHVQEDLSELKEEPHVEVEVASKLKESIESPAPVQTAQVSDSPHSHLDFASLRYVGQIHGTYLIAEYERGFYLIDQHAAQERIRYEAFMAEEVDTSQQQTLLIPLLFKFDHRQIELLDRYQDKLDAIGIHLQSFGPQSYQLESYPQWMNHDELDRLIPDLLEKLDQFPDLNLAQMRESTLIMQSCRGAIKANQYLSDSEAKALIEGLAGLEDPYHCPHGRPVLVEFDQITLEKLFKRIQDPHQGGKYHD